METNKNTLSDPKPVEGESKGVFVVRRVGFEPCRDSHRDSRFS